MTRYSNYFQLEPQGDLSRDELAIQVAQHFENSLDMNEGETIANFMTRLKGGKSLANNNKRSKRERRDTKKRKASSSRKRDRDEWVGHTPEKVDEDDQVYCICHKPSYGDMIACDGETCPNPSQWYHLECVGLQSGAHPDTWLCPECQ